MKRVYYLSILLLFSIFIPKVYAFTYEIDANVDTTSVKTGAVKEITVSLKNIQGTSDGILACSLDIEFDENITLNTSVRTLNNWSMTYGEFYLFDTGSPVLKDTKIFVIPVKINGNGTVKLVDIKCSDGNTNEVLSDKSVNFTILSNVTENNSQTGNNSENNNNGGSNSDDENNSLTEGDSNCDLSDIILSEGSIEFDSSVTEYSIKINDFESLEVTPILISETSEFMIDKNSGLNNEHSVVITVNSENGNTKVYTIYVEETGSLINDDEKEEDKNNYVPIFIGIICVLVLINIVRIITKKKK